MSEAKTGISANEVRDRIKSALKKQYKMTVYAFAHSELPDQWGVKAEPKEIACYLSENGVVNYRVFRAMYAALGLGGLERKQVTRVFYQEIKPKIYAKPKSDPA